MKTIILNKKLLITVCVIVGALVVLGSAVGSAFAAGDTPFEILYSKEGYNNPGPSALWTIPDWGLLCVEDNGETRCYCRCSNGACEDALIPVTGQNPAPTQTPTIPPNPSGTKPTPTVIPLKTSTPTIEYGEWVTHRDANGREIWTRCVSTQNLEFHRNHGHEIPDDFGGACIIAK